MVGMPDTPQTVSIAMSGAGGAGVVTAGQTLLAAAAKAGWYGLMTRSSGPQIRGGESAAFLRLGPQPVDNADDLLDIHIAFDWMNIERFAAELPLDGHSLIICDPAAGELPEVIRVTGARVAEIPMRELAKTITGGRPNMIGLGLVSALIGLPPEVVIDVVTKQLARKGAAVQEAAKAGIEIGLRQTAAIEGDFHLPVPGETPPERWRIGGNAAVGMGALRGGLRFVAAYPITPATEVLEWLAPNLEKVGGHLLQAEDELASANMIIGGSFGGEPSLTATSGPGLALMMESIGLAVAAEVPIVVVDVMRGGPSTGIPTKSEQSDLNIACYGLHGDAPHVVTAPNNVADCLFTAQWTMHLAETLQTPAILLSDQQMGQALAIIDRPADIAFMTRRERASGELTDYRRYAATASGVSPMAIPGTPGGEYVADGLEHSEIGRPSSQSEDHAVQLEKRRRKIEDFDYGGHWADIEGDDHPEVAIVTWGSATGAAREALARATADGIRGRLISMRLLMPAQTDRFEKAIDGVERLLVVEQTHSRQFHRYLRAHYDLPRDVKVLAQSGPLPVRPGQIHQLLTAWS